MKVLLLAENWPPRIGGIENYLTHIAAGLPSGSTTVVAPKVGIGYQVSDIKGIEIIRKKFFWPLVKPAWLPLFIWLFRKARREQFDVVLCGKGLFEGLAGYYLKQHLGIPYVVFTYAMEIETWAKRGRDRRKLMRVLTAADRVVHINEVTKQTLLSLGVGARQLVRIWPGVDDKFFNKPAEQDIRAVLGGYRISRPYVLCVARLMERKGIDVLIEAFAELDQTRFGDAQLIIVGEGPERKNLERLISRLWMDKSVKLIGEVPDDRLVALYHGAQVFALTPREVGGDFEGFGIVYLEAGAAGLPVIATRTGGVPEAVEHKRTGLLVTPDSPDAIRKALGLLLGDEKLRVELGQQGKKRTEDEFRWSKVTSITMDMIHEVIPGSR